VRAEPCLLGGVFQLGLELVYFGLLELGDEVVGLHRQVLVVIARILFEPRVDGLSPLWLKYHRGLFERFSMDALLHGLILERLLWLWGDHLLYLSPYFGSVGWFLTAGGRWCWVHLLQDEFVGHRFKLLLDLSNRHGTLSI
jgi:hypothetical protein